MAKKLMYALVALCGWAAVMLQLYLIILNRTQPVAETVIRFFSYFTILTNILCALCATAILFVPASAAGKFFYRQHTLAALTVYILTVGIIYNLLLRHIWAPQGLQRVVDEMLHVVNPLLFTILWLRLIPKNELQWKNAFPWLIYPLFYIACVLSYGSVSGFYPYPFVDVSALGYPSVLINSLGVGLFILAVSFLVISTAKLTGRKTR